MQTAVLTVADVAHQARMSPRQVYRLLKAGKLRARKSGRKTLIPSDEFVAWLNSLPVANLEAR